MTTAAIIGAGTMGSAIGARLLEQGCALSFFDASDSAGGELADGGASRCASAAEAASGTDFVITSLNSAAIVEAAVFGPQGVAEGMSAGGLLIDMSSIDPARTAAMAERLASERDAAWVDAPLSGGAPAARAGKLTLMIGGEDAAVARAKDYLAMLAARQTHLGPAGAGQTVKLVNQVLCAGNFLIVAEAVRFAEANGIDATLIPRGPSPGGRADSAILQEFMGKDGTAGLFAHRPHRQHAQGPRNRSGTSALASRTPLPLTSLITDFHRMFVAAGLGPADSAEYMKLFNLAGD